MGRSKTGKNLKRNIEMGRSETGNRKRKHVLGAEKDNEELKYLEKIILGDGSEILADSSEEEITPEKSHETEIKLPAWKDDSDCLDGGSNIATEKRDQNFREKKFLQVVKRPKWADYSESKDEKQNILQTCGNFITKSTQLEQGMIEFKKLKDLNSQTYNEGPIKAVKFHPKATVALVAGLSGIVSLFQVDGKENTKLQSIKFHKFPIHCAAFVKDAEEFVVGSKHHKYFNTFNLMTGQTFKVKNTKIDGLEEMRKFVVSPDDKNMAVCGRFGKIFILSTKTKECIDSFQMNCDVNSLAYSHDGSKLYSHGTDGEVYVWDMKSRRCLQKFTDDGCLSGTALDVSSNNAYLACGSSTGVVNIYTVENIMSNNCAPLKTLFNLVTPITDVKFNPTSEILSIASSHKENAVKLVHLPSRTVFSNFPALQNKLNFTNCMDFSPNSGYFAIGDSKKTVHLYRLKYYGNY